MPCTAFSGMGKPPRSKLSLYLKKSVCSPLGVSSRRILSSISNLPGFLPSPSYSLPFLLLSQRPSTQLQHSRYISAMKLSSFECLASAYLFLISSAIADEGLDGNTVGDPFCLENGQGGERRGVITGSCSPLEGIAGVLNQRKNCY